MVKQMTKRDLIELRDATTDAHTKSVLRWATARIDKLEGIARDVTALTRSIGLVAKQAEEG